MKKISSIALVLITSLAASAQTETSKPTPMAITTRFGIKAGVNLAKLRPSDDDNQYSTNLKTTFGGGAFVNIPLGTGGVAVQPEVLYSRQGSKITQTTTVGTSTTTNTYEQDLGYITVPVMLQWKSTGGFYVETGPQAGFLIAAQQEGPGTDNDFSWGAGVGFLSRVGLGIGARYNHGFTNVLDNDGDNNPSIRNSVVNLYLSWSFGAGK
jgi:hypothetical protein